MLLGLRGAPERVGTRLAVAEAQRFAEVLKLEVHRNTWRYHFLLEQHRQTIAELREDVLSGHRAVILLRDRVPAQFQRLTAEHSDERVAEAARQIVLHHLDDAWASYLSETAALRESIHLRAFANLDPVDEFHRAVIPLFRNLMTEIGPRSAETFQQLELSDPDWSMARMGLDRPTATWTYVADDTTFGVAMEQFFAGMLRFVGGGWRAAKNRG